MKVIVALFSTFLLISAVNCSNGTLPKIPGCEKIKDFADIPLKKCCDSIPKLIDPSLYKDCIETCKPSKDDHVSKFCCMSDCVLKAAKLLNETGFFDFDAAKSALNEKVSNDEKWVAAIKSSIETCTIEAPKKLEEWKKKNPPKCETALNMISKHCIARQLFFNCPSKTDTKECKDLEEFGKQCPIFPAPGKHGKINDDEKAKEE